jgi:glutaredoxin
MAKMAANPLDKTPIKVFSLQTCAHCKAVKKILQQQQIPFRIVYVDMLIGEERNKIISELKRLRSGFKSFNRAQDQGGENTFNRRNTSGISRIKRFSPTLRLGSRGGFETTSNPARSFPTLVIGGKTLVGFKKETLLQMLANLQGET